MSAPQPIANTAADPANDVADAPLKAVSTSAELLHVLEQSRLVGDNVVRDLRALLKADPATRPLSLAAKLVRDNDLTLWQSQQLLAGKTQFFLGRYKFLDRLGVGGMGAVFKAEHEIMGRIVALKMIRRRMLEDPKTRERFLREIRATAKLTDPNIVIAYDADRVGNVYFLVMEYVDGKDLGWWVEHNGPFSSKWACEFSRQTALGLQHAHMRGLVHLDIKPTNLLAVAEPPPQIPSIKILDFGLSQLATEDLRFDANAEKLAANAHVTSVAGTFGFMAPEQFRQPPRSDIRSDIFSLGCTLFYLLTGQLPFPSTSDREYISGLTNGKAMSARSLKAEIPEAVEQIMQKALAPNPGDRYQTPRELADALLPLSASFATSDSGTSLSTPLPSSVAVRPSAPRTLVPSVDAALGEFDVRLTSGPADIFNLDFDQVSAADRTRGATSLPSPFDYRRKRRRFFKSRLFSWLFWPAVAGLAILLVIKIVSCAQRS